MGRIIYIKPDFEQQKFKNCPNATFAPAPADKTLPDGFCSTTNHPTYVKIDGIWRLPKEPRMDASIVIDKNTKELYAREMRAIIKEDLVVIAREEDGSEGIYVHSDGFIDSEIIGIPRENMPFMATEITREKPIDYKSLAELIYENRNPYGYTMWVIGPAVDHTKSQKLMSWLIDNGYIGMLTGGNAVAVHDIEYTLTGGTLGSDDRGRSKKGGHGDHMRAINEVRKAGSIENLVKRGILTRGIMYCCVKNNIPYILAGSIRDDGPLPETITDVIDSQVAMREHTKKATLVVMMATALHSIGTGNMLPTYIERNNTLEPLPTICVDQTEFIINKLKDRGTHQAHGVVTNVQDFLEIIVSRLKLKI